MDRLGKKSAARTTPLSKGHEAESKLKLWTIRQCKWLKHGRREKEEVRGKTPSPLLHSPELRSTLRLGCYRWPFLCLDSGILDRLRAKAEKAHSLVPRRHHFRGPGSLWFPLPQPKLYNPSL